MILGEDIRGERVRILLLTHSYSPENSPPQRRWNAFVQHFRTLGWGVDVVTPVAHFPFGRRRLPREHAGRAFQRYFGRHGERIWRAPYLRHGTSRVGRFADQIVSASFSVPLGLLAPRPSVIVATAPSLPTLVAGYFIARLRNVPLIVEMRDAWPDLATDARVVKGGIKSFVSRVITAIQSRADLVVTVTDGFADVLRQRGMKRVVSITNGVDTERVTALEPPNLEKSRLEVLYLGNHGESQHLETIIRASAIVGHRMRLTMVGHGTQRPALIHLAKQLEAPVQFHDPVSGSEAMEFYRRADSCVISLRDDWRSFEATVPSKTYEVLATGRHITGIVRGEAAELLTASQSGDIVACTPAAVSTLWLELVENRAKLITGSSGREWAEEYADHRLLAEKYETEIRSMMTGL